MKKSITALLAVAALALGLVLGVFGGQQAGRVVDFADKRTPLQSVSPQPTLPVTANTLLPALPSAPPHSGNADLLLHAVEVLDALKANDFKALSKLAAPEGVTFTPLSTVDKEADLTLTPDEIAKVPKDTKTYIWGIASGTGKPIELTPAAYFQKYVFNADYTTAPSIGVNQVIATGNALENVKDAYPDCHFVEFYFPGLDPAKEGFDWCSLKLVFRTTEESSLLVGLIHSEWTT